MPSDARRDAPADPNERRLLDVRIVPHRSLTPSSFRIFMLVFSLVGTVSSLPFVIAGAWPVAGFMGLDVAFVYLAFRASFKAARAYEDVVLTPLELMLAKVSPRGTRREWRFNPVWVRLDKKEHAEYGLLRLALISRGEQVEVAGFLGPDAKAVFASDLSHALNLARRGPQFD